MTSDSELLRRYAESGSESAFTELVQRHLGLVYSAALRQVNGDAHLAQDVAQSVFTDLARKAALLSRRQALTGWLYTSTHFASAKAVRTERRRHNREQEAHAMRELLAAAPDPDWDALRPVLDTAMQELAESDRDAILFRYFENRPMGEIGERLGLSEDAARKRVDRALEKLRSLLARRGVTTTSTLAAAISVNAIQSAPAGLAASVVSGSLAGAAAVGSGLGASTLTFMAMTKLQMGIVGALVVAGLATPMLVQHQSQVRLREENRALREETSRLSNLVAQIRSTQSPFMKRSIGPRLPAPSLRTGVQPAVTPIEDLRATNVIAGLMRGETPKITTAQLESYLNDNRRNAASLVAAFRATGDPALLTEATQKYPDDPLVDFAAVFKNDASPEERRHWLDAFKRSAPDNALANYLTALDDFRSGKADLAVQELNTAFGKPQFQDYSMDLLQNAEEAYRAAGFSVAEAKTLSSYQLLLPHLSELKQLNQKMVDLAASYRQSGDSDSAQSILQMDVELGRRFDGSPGQSMISQLVGIAIQRIALNAMDPNSAYDSTGKTAKSRSDELAQRRADLTALAQQMESIMKTMSEQDLISYKDRWRAFGEEAAFRWVVGKFGQK
jgi:RNA polymerase sigma factor (sigma-70 family)